MNYFISTYGEGIKTPYADKIAEAERLLREEDKPAYLPQLYKILGVDFAEPVLLPEKWPKENPFLNLAPFPERAEMLPRKNEDAFVALAEALKRLETAIVENLTKTVQPIIIKVGDIINLYPNKRVIYLAKHGKKRVRKKNINRVKKWIKKRGNTTKIKTQ